MTSTVNGVASTALDLAPIISAATTNTLSLSGNTLTSDVNGVASTTDAVESVSNASAVNTATVTVNGIASTGAPIINSNEISVTGSSLTSTVNGVASTALDLTSVISAATTNTLSLSGNTLTSDVNGVASTTDAVGSVSNASAVNTATVTVNGIASTGAPIINSNEISVTGSSLTSTVNGVASTALDLTSVISAATTNTLSLSGNTLTSDVNGVASTTDAVGSVSNASAVNTATVTVNGIASTGAPIINSNEISVTGSSLTSTVNGVASTALDLTSVISAATTNDLTALNGNLISTVNGVASTPAVPILVTADNGLTTTNGNVQLGGTLTSPTTIITDPTNTLSIQGLTFGNPFDDVIVIDQFGLLRSLPSKELNMNDWSINGNMNIQSSFQFLGTLDDADLVFRRNNILSGRLQTNNTSFGVNALVDSSGGADNVAVGTSALENNNSGQRNSALGFSAMAENTTGTENTGVGYYALNSNTIGGQNTAFGNYAFQGNTTGNRNTSIGYYSGYMGVGEDITLLGAFTTFTDGIVNATAIGSGASVNTSNSLVLGALETNIGIGTYSPTNPLHVITYDNLDPIRFEGLKPSTSSSDLAVVIDATGVLKTKAVVTGIRSISGNYAFTPDDYTIIARNLTNDITITLPDAPLNSGRILIINQFNLVKPDTSPLVVNFNVPVIYSDTEAFPYISTSIFGGPRGQSVKITLQSDGVDWYVVSYTI
ncbi:hypothetical protein BSF42_35700 [Flavobacterium sp. ACN6]|nr:hypothetical protein BSF42_35700 [Flavobacterium sp. ACN6]